MKVFKPTNPPAEQLQAPVSGPFWMLANLLLMFALAIPAVFVVGFLTFLFLLLPGYAGFIAPLLAVMTILLIAAGVRRLRMESSSRLLNYLALATRLNLPLPEFLDALRRGEGAGVSRRSQSIARDIRAGSGLGDALFAHSPELPAHQTAVIWRGEQFGRLREAVAHVAERSKRVSKDAQAGAQDIAMSFALLVFIFLLGIASAVGIFILPHFEEIFLDFEADFPRITQLTFDWAKFLTPVLAGVAVLALLAMLGGCAYSLFYSGEAIVGPVRRTFDDLWWRVPVLSDSYRNRAWADACFSIEQAMAAGWALPEAIEAARHPVQSGVANRRLRSFAELIRQGTDMQQAARQAKLPGLIVGMLGTSGAASRPADVFAFLSRYYTHRVSPIEAVVRASFVPAVTLLAAVMVGWFVFAVFYPLIVLRHQGQRLRQVPVVRREA